MKIITEPTVTVVGVTQFFPHPKYKLPTQQPHIDKMIGGQSSALLQGTSLEQITAMARKGCYDSYGEDGRDISAHIKSLIESKHGSVLEHGNISLFLEGISRGCSHEIVRHRAGFAYSQRSTGYVDEGDCAIVLDPFYSKLYEEVDRRLKTSSIVEITNNTLREFINSCEESNDNYIDAVNHLLLQAPQGISERDKRKWARGKARQLLPHAIETRMTMTGNLRAWRHFIEQRSNRFAEAEIRRLSNAIWHQIWNLAPTVFSDYEMTLVDGYHEYTTPNTKV